MRVLGVDPGSENMGWGVVESIGTSRRAIAFGTLRVGSGTDFPARLRKIHEGLKAILEEHHPEAASVESIFHAQNAQSALKLGQARGAILLTLALADLPIHSYTPMEIKKALVGYGKATKEQVREMIRLLLGLRGQEIGLDASDALAAALTHLNSQPASGALAAVLARRR